MWLGNDTEDSPLGSVDPELTLLTTWLSCTLVFILQVIKTLHYNIIWRTLSCKWTHMEHNNQVLEGIWVILTKRVFEHLKEVSHNLSAKT